MIERCILLRRDDAGIVGRLMTGGEEEQGEGQEGAGHGIDLPGPARAINP